MTHLSTLDLHKLRLGELPPSRAADAQAHLSTCDRCTERMGVAEAEEAAFDASLPPALAAALSGAEGDSVDDGAPASPTPAPPSAPGATPAHWLVMLRRLGPASMSLLAAAIVLLVATPMLQQPTAPEGDGIRTRGDLAGLEVWIDTDAGVRALRVGEALAPGDRVQLLYHPRGAERVGLAGRDQSGTVEVYGVLTPTRDGLQPAPFGLSLDDTPGNQEFFVVSGGRLLDEAQVKAAIAGDVPGVEITRVVVPKEVP